ncbi:MAG: fumarylacetoacetate hydrolase family protein [Nannocystaceae bacterium]
MRVRTDGAAPGPESEVEEIRDPFAGSGADAWSRAHEGRVEGGLSGPLGRFALVAPVHARKVIGVGRNYRAHAQELGNEVPSRPLLFLKAATCLVACGAPIVLPRGYERIDMEAELVVVIGRMARGVTAASALKHVCGYCLGNDVSNRDLQRQDSQWTRAKGFDTSGPLGPFVRLCEPGALLPMEGMRIRGYLNDELVQDGRVGDMLFDIPTLVAHISETMTLEPGDLIYTGTPAGVAALQPGAFVRIEMRGFELGTLTNPVV